MDGLLYVPMPPPMIKRPRGRPKLSSNNTPTKSKIRNPPSEKSSNVKEGRKDPANRTKFKRMRLWKHGEVNHNRVYLPPEWKCYATKRSSGIHKGIYDLIYVTPKGDKLRSRNEIYKWGKINKIDVDPRKFLFARETDILFSEHNAKSIIFRKATVNHKTCKRNKSPEPSEQDETVFNTVISESGREMIEQDDEFGASSSGPKSQGRRSKDAEAKKEGKQTEGGTVFDLDEPSDTPRKKKGGSAKPRNLNETLACLKSPYFAIKNEIPVKPVSILALHNGDWIPPRSPYSLIQEDLYHNPWQLLIATIFLNCTTGKLAIPIIHEFLSRWPTPHDACSASLFDILEVVRLLGLGRTRAATIIRFSHEFLTLDWKKPSDLFGIGKYGSDSYKVFCLGQWRKVESDDKYLNLYINWMHNIFSSRPSIGRVNALS